MVYYKAPIIKYIRFVLYLVIVFSFGCHSEKEEPKVRVTIEKVVKPELKFSNAKYQYVSDFELYVKETMAETSLPGSAVAIIKNDEVLLLKGFGVKTFESVDSVDVHTVFRIASVSKGFASMLTGILVQDSLLNWDEKVHEILPDFKLANEESTNNLTVRHILSQSSGLPPHTFTNLIEEKIPYTTLRDNLRYVEISEAPGETYGYQNVIYSLIGDIVQAVTKQPYGNLICQRIFKPLNMYDATVSYNDLVNKSNLAQPHIRCSNTKYKTIQNTPEYYTVLPAAGVNASISDMAKWLLALLGNNENIIKKTTLDEMFKPQIFTPRMRKYQFFHWPHLKEAYYGLGWRVLNYWGHTLIYHGGHVNGYRAEVMFCPADKIGIVVLTNATGILANNACQVFFDMYLGDKN